AEKIVTKPLATATATAKQINKKEPANIASQQIIGPVTKQPEQNFYMPVSIQENDAAKQIIVKEESSDSKTASVKIYYMGYENGEWVLKPEWIVTAKEIILDSLPQTFDTSSRKLKRIFPAQQ